MPSSQEAAVAVISANNHFPSNLVSRYLHILIVRKPDSSDLTCRLQDQKTQDVLMDPLGFPRGRKGF